MIGVHENSCQPSYVKTAHPEPIQLRFITIRSSIWTHIICDNGWSEWEKQGSQSWLKSYTGSDHVIRRNDSDSMLTMRCNKKMIANEWKYKEIMEGQPHWRTFKAMFIFVLFFMTHIR